MGTRFGLSLVKLSLRSVAWRRWPPKHRWALVERSEQILTWRFAESKKKMKKLLTTVRPAVS
jgi:hypothetical protein